MADITEQVRPDSGAVRKLFTLDGRQVTPLEIVLPSAAFDSSVPNR